MATNKGFRFEGEITSYKKEFLDCRENHNWVWITDWKILRGVGGQISQFSRRRRCQRCGTTVDRTYDGKTGRVVSTRYNYTEGYLSSPGKPITAGEARLETLRREVF